MSVRPHPLFHGRWWDATLNWVFGCKPPADSSCFFCYAAFEAAGLQDATNPNYRGLTVFRKGRKTWNGQQRWRDPDDPEWWAPFRLSVPQPRLLGPDKPALLWVNSMADLFAPGIPLEIIDRIFVTVSLSPHIGLVLTKYPAPLVDYFGAKPDWWRQKIWLGFSAGEQGWWDIRWRIMRPMAERGWRVFTSIQPMLGPVILPPDFLALAKWVIVGGEQPPGHRWMNPDWARSLQVQCFTAPARPAFFFKQMTSGRSPLDLLYRRIPTVAIMLINVRGTNGAGKSTHARSASRASASSANFRIGSLSLMVLPRVRSAVVGIPTTASLADLQCALSYPFSAHWSLLKTTAAPNYALRTLDPATHAPRLAPVAAAMKS